MMSNDLQLLWKNVIANIFLAKSCGVHKPFAQAWSISAIDYSGRSWDCVHYIVPDTVFLTVIETDMLVNYSCT